MRFPTPWTLQLKRYISTTTDDRGNDVAEYDDPIAWPVHSYAPGANDEPGTAGRDLSLILWTVHAPATGLIPSERDLVTIDGVDFEVDGRPSDWSHGPWPFPGAGIVVLLRRAEG